MNKTIIVFAFLLAVVEFRLASLVAAQCPADSPPLGTYLVRTWNSMDDVYGPPSSTSSLEVRTDDCIVYRGEYHEYSDSFVAFYAPATRMLTGGWVSEDGKWGAISYRWTGTRVGGRWVAYAQTGTGYEEWIPQT